jgi:hypothetical protein
LSRSRIVRSASSAYQAVTPVGIPGLDGLFQGNEVVGNDGHLCGFLSIEETDSGPGLEDEVDRRFVGYPDAGEAGIVKKIRQNSWTGLWAEGTCPRLGE